MIRALARVALLMLPALSPAQNHPRLSAGVGATFFESTGKVRLSPAFQGHRNGFGPALGLNWHTTEFARESKGLAARGDLRIRPVMVGLSYTRIRGKLAATAALVGGYSFNHVASTTPASSPVELRVENSLAWAPRVGIGLDLTRRVGFVTSASYLVTRPQVTVQRGALEDRGHFRADTLIVQAGIVFAFF